MTSPESLLIFALVTVSALMAASEISLFSLSRFQLRTLKEHFEGPYRRIRRLLGDPGGLLITTLVVNEIINIALSSLITKRVVESDRLDWLEGLGIPLWAVNTIGGTILTAPLVLIVCEVTPKVIAARLNQVLAPILVGPLHLLYRGMLPIRMGLKRVVSAVSNRISTTGTPLAYDLPGEGNPEAFLKESDFLMMVEEGHREGAVQEAELELIRNVFDLDDTTVADITTPLKQVLAIPLHTTLRGALVAVQSQRYSRIPVVTANYRQVVGILYAKDLLRMKMQPGLASATVETVMRKPLMVLPSLRLNALFRKFKQLKTHMAIVQGPRGEPIGIVTMSDVLNALFEDILEEDEAG